MQIRAALVPLFTALVVSSAAIPVLKRDVLSTSSTYSDPSGSVTEDSVYAPGYSETEITDMVDDIAAMTDYESESVDIQTPGGDIVYVDQAAVSVSDSTVTVTRTVSATSSATPSSTAKPSSSVVSSSTVKPSSTIASSSTAKPSSSAAPSSTIKPSSSVASTSSAQPSASVSVDASVSSSGDTTVAETVDSNGQDGSLDTSVSSSGSVNETVDYQGARLVRRFRAISLGSPSNVNETVKGSGTVNATIKDSSGTATNTVNAVVSASGTASINKVLRARQLPYGTVYTNEAIVASCPGCAPSLPLPTVSSTVVVSGSIDSTSFPGSQGGVDATENTTKSVSSNGFSASESQSASVSSTGSTGTESVSFNVSPFFNAAAALYKTMQNNQTPSVAVVSDAVTVSERSIPPRLRRYANRFADLD